jgi:hypothetical protein
MIQATQMLCKLRIVKWGVGSGELGVGSGELGVGSCEIFLSLSSIYHIIFLITAIPSIKEQ